MILIDKEQAYKTLSEYYHHTRTLQHMALREALDRVPAVDAVPVVRCKDCVRNPENDAPRAVRSCSIVWYMGQDGFCSKGERCDE